MNYRISSVNVAAQTSTNRTQQILHKVSDFVVSDRKNSVNPVQERSANQESVILYYSLKEIADETTPRLNPEALEELRESSADEKESSVQTTESNTIADPYDLPEVSDQTQILLQSSEMEDLNSKGMTLYNKAKSAALESAGWVDPVIFRKDERHDYASEIKKSIYRYDPQLLESSSREAADNPAAGFIPPENSIASDSRTGSGIRTILDGLDIDQIQSLRVGISETVANKTNKARLKLIIEEDPETFNAAVFFAGDNLIKDQIIDAEEPTLDFTDHRVLTEVLEKVTKFKLAQDLTNSQPYELNIKYTGEKNDSEFCLHSSRCDYDQKTNAKNSAVNQINAVNEEINSPLNSYNQPRGIYSEEIQKELEISYNNSRDIVEHLYKLETDIDDVKENAPAVIDLTKAVVKVTKPPQPITLNTAFEGDHVHRKNTRVGLEQRLLTTDLSDDSAECVFLPKDLHDIKESKGGCFEEPPNFSYDKGIYNYLDILQENIIKTLERCSEKDLQYVPLSDYIASYKKAFDNKKVELKYKFPNCSSVDIFKIYHSNVAAMCNYRTLDAVYNKTLKTGISIETKQVKSGESLISSKDHPIGQKFIELQKETLNDTLISIYRKNAFINSLKATVSPEARPYIEKIQRINHRTVLNFLDNVELSLGRPTTLQIEALSNDETLFEVLETTNPKTLGINDDVDLNDNNRDQDQLLYDYGKNVLKVTTVGNKYFDNSNVLTFNELQKSWNQTKDPEPPLKLIGKMEAAYQLNNQAGIADTLHQFEGFDTQENYDFYKQLTGQDPYLTDVDAELPTATAIRIIKIGKINNMTELLEQRHLLQKIPGIGLKTENNIIEFITKVENKFPLQRRAYSPLITGFYTRSDMPTNKRMSLQLKRTGTIPLNQKILPIATERKNPAVQAIESNPIDRTDPTVQAIESNPTNRTDPTSSN